jgi:lysyl-tRNA synthetase class 2
MEEALQADRFDEIMGIEIEPGIGLPSPTFLYDYPAEAAALSRRKNNHPELAERFELTDPQEQRERFERERAERRRTGKPIYPFPEKFIDSLHLMPECAGIALGVDRLVMLFADEADIRNVVSFTPEEL